MLSKILFTFFVCFVFTEINAESIKILNSTITWINLGDSTDFKIELPLTDSDNYWLGIGLNQKPQMVVKLIF